MVNRLEPLDNKRLDEILDRQTILKKWVQDYESCTYEEDYMASTAFDDMVDDIDFLFSEITKLVNHNKFLMKLISKELFKVGKSE